MRTKKQSNVKRIMSTLLSVLITVSAFTGLTAEASTTPRLTLKGNLKGMVANPDTYELHVDEEKDFWKTWFNKHYTISNANGECYKNKFYGLYGYGNNRNSLKFHYRYNEKEISKMIAEITKSKTDRDKDPEYAEVFGEITKEELDDKIQAVLKDERIWASPGVHGYVLNATNTFGAAYYTDFFSVDTDENTMMTRDIIDNFFLGTQIAFFKLETQNSDPIKDREMSFSKNPNNAGKKNSYGSISTCGSITLFSKKSCCPEPPEITSDSSCPLISAMVDNKNDCIIKSETIQQNSNTTEYIPGEELNPRLYMSLLYDTVETIASKDPSGAYNIACDLKDIIDNINNTGGSQSTSTQSQYIVSVLGQSANMKLAGANLKEGYYLPFNGMVHGECQTSNSKEMKSIMLKTMVGDNSKAKSITKKDIDRRVIYAYLFSVKFKPKKLSCRGHEWEIESGRKSTSTVSISCGNERSIIKYRISNFPKIGVKSNITLYENESVNLKNLSGISESGLTWRCQVSEKNTANSANAEVTSAGVVTGLKAGTATIAVTKKIQDTTYTEYCKVTVKKLTPIKNFKLSSTIGSVTARWDKSADSANYELEIKKANSNGKSVKVNLDTNTRSYTFNSTTAKALPLEANTKYRVSIKPYVTKNGKKIYGTEVAGYEDTCKEIGAITAVNVDVNLPKKMTVSWNQVDDVTGYQLSISDITDPKNSNLITYHTANTKYAIPNLKPGHRYSIRVEAYKTFSNNETFSGASKTIGQYTPAESLSEYTVSLDHISYRITGKELTPNILCVKDENGNELRKGIDYSYEYKNNISPGTASVIVKGKGSFSGQKTTTYTIYNLPKPKNLKVTAKTPESISVSWDKVLNATNYKLVISDMTSLGSPIVTTRYTSATSYRFTNLTSGHNYTIEVSAYLTDKNNKTHYSNSTFIDGFVYTPRKNLDDYYITLSGSSFSYTGNQIKPDVVRVCDDNGNVLVKDTDYSISYGANKRFGKGTVTITGKGSYIGSQTVTFDIKKPSLATPATLTATKSGSKITLNWSKVNLAEYYEITAIVNGDYHSQKTVYGYATGDKTTYTFSNLTGNSVYFSISAYVIGADGTRVYSNNKPIVNPIYLN